MEACEVTSAPYTLLGFLLNGDGVSPMISSSSSCSASAVSDGSRFFRDYAARGTNALIWISLISITLLLLRKLGRLVRFWAQGNRIPGPPCYSFYGHSKLIVGCGSGVDLTGYLSKLHEKYGPLVRLWLGPTQLMVSVKDTALIEEVLIKAVDKLPLTGRAFRLAFGRSSLFVSSFEKVRQRRESLAVHLNGKLLERANAIPLKVVECVMGRVDSMMAKGLLDCRSVSQHMAFCILGATLFGDAFLAWSDATVYEELLMKVAKDGCFWASYNIPPFWRRGFWRYQLLCSRLKRLTLDIIQQCRYNYTLMGRADQNSYRETKINGKEVEVDPTFLHDDTMSGSLFLEEIEGHLISNEEPCGNILGVMFHGCLTISSLMGSTLTRLAMHPEIQEKIYSEIIAVRKTPCKLDSHDVQKMHFLLATVYESARLLPAGPLLQRCSLKHDLSLKTNITVPAGAILVVPLQLVQMDTSIWGKDACQFNPDRFLSKSVCHGGSAAGAGPGSLAMSSFTGASEAQKEPEESPFILSEPNKNAAFLTFGSGTRACIGQKFAILGISTLFASLLQNYEIRLQPGSENDPKPTMDDCVLQLLPSPKIVFVRRSN